MERATAMLTGSSIGIGVGYAFLALIVITLDRFRANGTSKDDTQVELKILLYGLGLAALMLGTEGVHQLVAFMLGGFKGGGDAIKATLAPIVVGGGVSAAILFMLLPRTNTATARTAEAIALLAVGLYYGIAALMGGYAMINSLVMSGPWEATSSALTTLAIDGFVALIALVRLGTIGGWSAPARPAAPPQQYPPQGGGYPPQGGGYPPQGGGYPPQGGGYPPQGGGYPPQGGGYPPQGGGYPR